MKTGDIFLLAFILCTSKISNAQVDSLKLKNAYYIGVGIAAGKGSHKGAFVLANLQVQHFESYLSFKAASFATLYFGNQPAPIVSELSLLLGKSYTLGQSHNIQFGTGLSLVTDVSRVKYETIRKRPIGLPMEMKYNYFLNRTGAISISLNVNLNKAQSYFGTAIGFTAGRLRPRFKNKSKN